MIIKRKYLGFVFYFLIILAISIFFRGTEEIKGTDGLAYATMYQNISHQGLLGSFFSYLHQKSFAFYFLSFIINFFFNLSSHYYLFTLNILLLFLMYYCYQKFFMDKEQKIKNLSLLLLLATSTFYFFSVNALRQGLAAPFVLLGFYYLAIDQYKNALKASFIGCMFHFSVFIFFVFFLFYPIWKKVKKPFVFFFSCCLISFFIHPQILLMVFDLLNLPFFSKEIIQFEVNRIPTSNSSVTLKIAVMITLSSFFYIISKYSKDVLSKRFSFVFFLTVSFLCLFLNLDQFLNRFMLFFSFAYPVLFAKSIHSFKNKELYFSLILGGGFVYFLYVINHPSVKGELF